MAQELEGFQSQVFDFNMPDTYKEANGAIQTGQLGIGARWGILQDVIGFQSQNVTNGIAIMLSPYQSGGGSEATTTVMASKNGQMILNTKYSQYWWLMGCGVQIAVDSPQAKLVAAGPSGTQDMSTASTSIGISAGMFGDQPTVTGSWSSSFSTSFSEFQCSDLSQLGQQNLQTLYYMASYSDGKFTPDGRNFLTWQENLTSTNQSFVDELAKQGGVGAPFRLHTPAPTSFDSAMPVLSQGIWVIDQSFTGVTTFSINFWISMAAWHTNGNGVFATVYQFPFSSQIQIDWSQVEGQGQAPAQLKAVGA